MQVGFDGLREEFLKMSARIAEVQDAVRSSKGVDDPIKAVAEKLGLNPDRLLSQLPLMQNKDEAMRADQDPEFLQRVIEATLLLDGMGDFIIGKGGK